MSTFKPDEDLVRRLSELLAETGLSEIEYEAEGQRIRVARNTGGAPVIAAAPPIPAETSPAPAAAAEPDAALNNAVLSPMVGTAYVASEPSAPPFVSVGDTITEGQTLLIIEAMKVMNQIPSPRSGRVTRIMVEDGQPVEFGEPLMIIE